MANTMRFVNTHKHVADCLLGLLAENTSQHAPSLYGVQHAKGCHSCCHQLRETQANAALPWSLPAAQREKACLTSLPVTRAGDVTHGR